MSGLTAPLDDNLETPEIALVSRVRVGEGAHSNEHAARDAGHLVDEGMMHRAVRNMDDLV